jgi:raffinose/stachyose/melibiose transport system permease protein
MANLNAQKRWRLPRIGPTLSLGQRKRILEWTVAIFFIGYALTTLFPFYMLFVRSFVSTKNTTELHIWIPPQEDIDLDAGIGNLAVYFDLDFNRFKEDMGIPVTDYLPARQTLRQIANKYDIPEERMIRYFAPFSVFNGWINLYRSGEYLPALARTALITVVSLVGLNVLAVATGYGLSGLRRKDQVLWYSLYLLRAVIPPMLIILPQFLLVQALLNLIPNYDTPGFTRSAGQLLAVMLLWVRGGALPAMLMTAAISAIPTELEEAAEMDGANPLQYFFYVLLPLLKVPMVSLTVIFLPLIWNDFIQPYIYLDQNNTTVLPLMQTFSGQYASNFQLLYTGIFVSVMPLVIIYVLFRRWFVEGAMAGAVKG